ncbi:MFS transporter [Nocardioides donggukensis]|uniref:MFS transporter n=1 Tax=Nocardioides donggukensis TaxID=2774019 RepID=A0A927Q0P5_9ACTN|nr:MFS transporter [Nocardioides donggukensis]MBD8869177.1 MFS transporter [Nocardioides donggukensis]
MTETWSADRRLTLLLLAVATGTNVPTPLLLIYRDRLAMTDASLTAVFGVYALGLMLALAMAGQAADRWGRRRVALPAAVGAVVASLLFLLAADSEALLYVVRFLQGATSGTVFSVGSAWLVETATRGGRTSGPRSAAVAMTAGFAIGPSYAGLIGEWGPWPLVLPYLLHVAVLLLALVASWSVAESLVRSPAPPGTVRSGAFRPGGRRTGLLVVAPLAICVYAFPATAVAGVPVLIGFPVAPVALTGLLAGLALGAGALAAPLQGRLGPRTAPVAAGCGVVGFGVTALAAAVPPLLPLAIPASVVLGAGGGLALASGLSRLPALAAEGRLGTVSAGFYATAYVGFGFPLMLAALSAQVSVALVLAALAGWCVVLAVQQGRARL